MTTLTSIDKFIDKIFYINLKERTDRKRNIEIEFVNYGITNYERIEAIKTTPGYIGCGLSHLNALKIAKERNYKNILIFEDDFTFLVSPEIFYQNISTFFEYAISFDVCFISYNILNYEEINSEFGNIVNKVIDSATASGYIINSSYFDKLIEIYTNGIINLIQTHQHWNYSIDRIWKKYQSKDNWYYFKTRLGKQREGFSNIANKNINYLDC